MVGWESCMKPDRYHCDGMLRCKILPFAAVMDPRQLARFKNEAQAAATLDHPNIVSVYAIGCDRGVHYFAMQFIAGQTLAEVIRDLQQREAYPPRVDGTRPPSVTSSLASSATATRNQHLASRNAAHFRFGPHGTPATGIAFHPAAGKCFSSFPLNCPTGDPGRRTRSIMLISMASCTATSSPAT